MDVDQINEELKKTHIFYLHETFVQSVARDIGTALVLVALWSLGHFAQSAALEWLGCLLGIAFIINRIIKQARGIVKGRMTPKEARDWLNENFPEATQ